MNVETWTRTALVLVAVGYNILVTVAWLKGRRQLGRARTLAGSLLGALADRSTRLGKLEAETAARDKLFRELSARVKDTKETETETETVVSFKGDTGKFPAGKCGTGCCSDWDQWVSRHRPYQNVPGDDEL